MKGWYCLFIVLVVLIGVMIVRADEIQIGSIIPDILLIDSGKEIIFRIDPNGNIYGMNYRFIGKLTDKEKMALEKVLGQYVELYKYKTDFLLP